MMIAILQLRSWRDHNVQTPSGTITSFFFFFFSSLCVIAHLRCRRCILELRYSKLSEREREGIALGNKRNIQTVWRCLCHLQSGTYSADIFLQFYWTGEYFAHNVSMRNERSIRVEIARCQHDGCWTIWTFDRRAISSSLAPKFDGVCSNSYKCAQIVFLTSTKLNAFDPCAIATEIGK